MCNDRVFSPKSFQHTDLLVATQRSQMSVWIVPLKGVCFVWGGGVCLFFFLFNSVKYLQIHLLGDITAFPHGGF